MRKFVPVAAAIAASVAVVAVPATLAYAKAPVHVLTIKKTGGTAVKTGAILKSSLKAKTSAVFTVGTSGDKLTCKAANFTAKVTANPVKPGSATESITAISTSKCTFSGITATLESFKTHNLPYTATVSDAAGFPVTIKGQSSSKPIGFGVVVDVSGVGDLTCNYQAASLKAHASNTGSTVAFKNQKFKLGAGSNGFCLAPAVFTATFGPVKDTSVTGSPAVFVN